MDIFYESRGSGEPLILIPGFASGAWSWAWQIDELAKTFQVVTFDPKGISRSKNDDDQPISIPSIAEDICALLDELDIARGHILGISFGGFVAMDFTLRFPARVDRLILASTSYGGPNHVAPAMPVLAAFAQTDGLNSPERIRKYLAVAFSPEFTETNSETVDRFCRLREENFVPREVYLQQLQSAMTFNLEHEVSKISSKTLVVTGDEDVVVPTQNSRNLAAAIPNAQLEIISDSGHMAFIEKAPEFNRVVTDFLERNL